MKLLILSDIHGNWPALKAIVAQEKSYDRVLCLGDIVNYGPHPMDCVRWVRDHVDPGWIVQGNHDRALGLDEDPCCSASYREMAAAMQQYTAGALEDWAKSYLANLPATAAPAIGGSSFFLCHAAPSDPLYAYVPRENLGQWEDETVFAGHPDYLFVGHTHLGFVRQFDETTIVNPGSAGQPKDGDPRAAYALWDNGFIEHRRAHYDIRSVVHDLDRCTSERIARQLGRILLSGGE